MVEFTLEELAAAVLAVAAEQPNHVYEFESESRRCKYFHSDGSCGCIFGHALHRLGISPGEMSGNGPIGGYLIEWFGGKKSDERYFPFRLTQRRQDSGRPWQEAVESLMANYPEV